METSTEPYWRNDADSGNVTGTRSRLYSRLLHHDDLVEQENTQGCSPDLSAEQGAVLYAGLYDGG